MAKPRIDLPDADEPLDVEGKSVTPAPRTARRLVEVPTNGQAVSIIEGTRRKLSELPVAPKHLNPIACICLYTMFGLDLQEIAIATGLPYDQIHAIRMSNEYGIMQRAVVDTVLEADTGEVKDFIKKSSVRAAQKVDALIDHGNADIALRASKDVLDRSGLRPADVIEHRHRMDAGLIIQVVDRTDENTRPVLDGVAEEQ